MVRCTAPVRGIAPRVPQKTVQHAEGVLAATLRTLLHPRTRIHLIPRPRQVGAVAAAAAEVRYAV